jgi:hypothetical protein
MRDQLGAYEGRIEEAARRAGIFAVLLPLGWICFPFAVQTVLHPGDAVGLAGALAGRLVPHPYTQRMLFAGELGALAALACLGVEHFFVTVMFYRRAGMNFFNGRAQAPTWPLAGVGVGIIGNGIWWISTGFDLTGALVGFTAMAMTIACELVIDQMGVSFVFGSGVPQPSPWA